MLGTGTGTGAGVSAVAAGTGYGLIAQADTTTPARSALRLVPQDTDPSSPSAGDIYVHTGVGRPAFYTGSQWEWFARKRLTVITNSSSLTAGDAGDPASVLTSFSNFSASIAANTLRARTIIKLVAWGDFPDPGSRFYLDPYFGSGARLSVLSRVDIDSTFGGWVYEATMMVRNIGASAVISVAAKMFSGNEPPFSTYLGTVTVDSTSALTLSLDGAFNTTGNEARCVGGWVEIA